MGKQLAAITICFAALLLFFGCDKKLADLFKYPDIQPVRQVLKTVLPLSYAANIAMAALEGAQLPNVVVATVGDSSVGTYLISIKVDAGFPLPAGVTGNGRILVAGFMAQSKIAMMSVMFTDLNVSNGTFTLSDVSTFPVVRHEDIITGKKELIVVYADIDVNAGSDTLLTIAMANEQIDAEFTRYKTMLSFDSTVTLDENAWIIRIDNKQTIDNASDDRYVISGGGQYVEVGSSNAGIQQITMINIAMTPLCTQNPIDGWVLMQNLGASKGSTGPGAELGHVLLTYHTACDGQADITAATGVYTKSWGKPIALQLDQ